MPLIFPILGAIGSALRIPLLISFFGTLIAQMAGWFVLFMSKRLAVTLALITAIVALTISLLLSVKGILYGLTFVLPDSVSHGASLVIPDNAPLCVSAILAVRTLRWVWSWTYKFTEYYV